MCTFEGVCERGIPYDCVLFIMYNVFTLTRKARGLGIHRSNKEHTN